jgi:hypothetical protein
VFDDAFTHGEGEIESAEGGVPLFEPGDDAERMKVMVESEAILLESCVEGLFACVAEGWMANVVGEGQSLGKFVVETEGTRDGAGDLGDFEGVSESGSKVVSREIASQPREDLGFAGETAESAGMQDASSVTRE